MSYSIFPKHIRNALLILFVCLFSLAPLSPLVPLAHGVTCSPPSVTTGCTIVITGSGVTISAEVPALSSVVPPTVSTDTPLTTVGETTVTLLGTLASLGDSAVTSEGFQYGLTNTYGTTTTATNLSGFGTGQFSANITALTCETTYHYKAYATNTAGTSTGTDETFTTDTCPVTPTPVPSPGGAPVITSSTVNFAGIAYPGAVVTVLRDGVVVISTVAGSDGAFLATASGIGAGSYVFSAYAKDPKGIISASSSFPFVINGKSIVTISGILIAPTLDIDKPVIQLNEKLTASGYGAPNTDIRITSHQFSQTFTAHTNATGAYSYVLSAGLFPTGAYTIRAEETVGTQTSSQSKGKMFLVGLSNLPPGTQPGTGGSLASGGCVASDFNCDGKVDIVDFSILKYWYKKPTPPEKVDLSGDGKVDLKDFSILAAEWTG